MTFRTRTKPWIVQCTFSINWISNWLLATFYGILLSNRPQKTWKNGQLNGLLTETGSTRMLKASDHETTGKAFSSLSALVDECCCTNGTANFTRVFTLYVDMVDVVYCGCLDFGWPNKELKKLSIKVQKFKSTTYEALSNYQVSKTGTRKRHAIDHICDTIREVDELVYLCTCMQVCLKTLRTDLELRTGWCPKEPGLL